MVHGRSVYCASRLFSKWRRGLRVWPTAVTVLAPLRQQATYVYLLSFAQETMTGGLPQPRSASLAYRIGDSWKGGFSSFLLRLSNKRDKYENGVILSKRDVWACDLWNFRSLSPGRGFPFEIIRDKIEDKVILKRVIISEWKFRPRTMIWKRILSFDDCRDKFSS